MLTGHRWTRLPDLPAPGTGTIVATAAAVSGGSVYVLADVGHTGDIEETGYPDLLRLAARGWAHVPMSPGAPASHYVLTAVAGGIHAAGSACPGKGGCTVDLETLAILRPGAHPDVVSLHTRPGVPDPASVAAGAGVVVVTNPRFAAAASPFPPTRKCLIYDITARTWHRGPDTPGSRIGGLGTYWTPGGVISLGQSGSASHTARWLLLPGRKA